MRRSISTTSGAQLGGPAQRLGAVAGLADHLDVVAHAEQRRQRLAEQRLVVDEQHAHGAPAHPGTSTRSVVAAARRPTRGRAVPPRPRGPFAQAEQAEPAAVLAGDARARRRATSSCTASGAA